jgi:hypothetical protein
MGIDDSPSRPEVLDFLRSGEPVVDVDSAFSGRARSCCILFNHFCHGSFQGSNLASTSELFRRLKITFNSSNSERNAIISKCGWGGAVWSEGGTMVETVTAA